MRLIYWLRRAYSGVLYKRVYRRLYPDRPFFTPRAISEIDKRLKPGSRVFEWGSGISTTWLAKRVAELITVEHDIAWYESTARNIGAQRLTNVTLVYAAPNRHENDFSWSTQWRFYEVLHHAPKKKEFKDYMSVIDRYPDSYFDCIAIDGRERIGCLMHAMQKLRSNGFVIFDDTLRRQYEELFDLTTGWRVERYPFGLKETTLLFPACKATQRTELHGSAGSACDHGMQPDEDIRRAFCTTNP